MDLIGNWAYPTNIRFGAGRINEIADACVSASIRRPLLVIDRHLSRRPITTEVLSHLRKSKVLVKLFDSFDSDPTAEELDAGIQVFEEGGHDGVLAFGGGSSIDLGKLIAFMSGQTQPVWAFEDIDDYWRRANTRGIAPVVAIPTTAGTGSEVSRAAVIKNLNTQEKKIIFHPQMMPKVVICDPVLTVGMPTKLTVGTGMDAFAHCLEGFSSRNFHPMSQGVALEGMRIVKRYLPRAATDPHDIEARANMMAAAAMGAVAFQNGLGAVHAISHPVGGLYHTHHGMTNAVVIPAVLLLNRAAIETRIAEAADYLAIPGGFQGFYDFVVKFNRQLGVPEKLSSLGVTSEQIDDLITMAMRDPSANSNPVDLTRANLYSLLQNCI